MRDRQSLADFIRGMDLKHPVTKEGLERINVLFRELNMRDHRTKKEKAMGEKLELSFEGKLKHIDYALAFKYQNNRSEMAKHCYLLFELLSLFEQDDLAYSVSIHWVASIGRRVLVFVNGKGDFLILDPETFEVMKNPHAHLICEVLPAIYECRIYQERRDTITDIITKNEGIEQGVCTLSSFETKVGGQQKIAEKLRILFGCKNVSMQNFVENTGVESRLMNVILKSIMQRALKNVLETPHEAQTQMGKAMVAALLFELLGLEDNECRAAFAGFEFVDMVACTGVKIRLAQMTGRSRYGVTIGNKRHGYYVFDPVYPEVLVPHRDFQALQYRLLPLADQFTEKLAVDLTVNDYLYYLKLKPLMLAEFVKIIREHQGVKELFAYAELDSMLRSKHFTDSEDDIYKEVMAFITEFVVSAYCEAKKKQTESERHKPEKREAAEVEVSTLIAAGIDNQRLWIIIHHFDMCAYAAEQYFMRAHSKFENDTAGALKDCDISLMFAPMHRTYFLRATLKASSHQLEAALSDCDKAIELNGSNLEMVHMLRMELCGKLKRDKEMIESATYLINQGERTDRIFAKRAASKLKLNDGVGALSDIEAALALNSSCTNYYQLRRY